MAASVSVRGIGAWEVALPGAFVGEWWGPRVWGWGDGSGLASREPAAGSCASVARPRPGDREFRSALAGAFQLGSPPTPLPATRGVGARSPPGPCASSPLTWWDSLFQKRLGEGGRELRRGSCSASAPSAAALGVRPLHPLWVYLRGRSGFTPGFFSESSPWEA